MYTCMYIYVAMDVIDHSDALILIPVSVLVLFLAVSVLSVKLQVSDTNQYFL